MLSSLKLAEKILKDSEYPLSGEEIWEKAIELGLDKETNLNGKTPANTILAQIYTNMKKPDTIFGKVEGEGKFYLKDGFDSSRLDIKRPEKVSSNCKNYNERDLHPLLSYFAFHDNHFNCITKTIYHEGSEKKEKGLNKWIHPDLVGAYLPFNNLKNETIDLSKLFYDSLYRLFSFEMKKKITIGNLRESYFQAVSNSSWANEGYLVSPYYQFDETLQEEMIKLNDAFGIGVIKLDVNDIKKSSVLFPATFHENLDWKTINTLAKVNPDLDKFLRNLISDIRGSKVHTSDYDKILTEDQIYAHITQKNIK